MPGTPPGFGTLPHDALALGVGELNAELRRQTEHELLLEIEQLLECGRSPARRGARRHRRAPPSPTCEPGRSRNRGDALDHPLRAQQTPDPRGGAGIGAPAFVRASAVEQRADLNALQQPETPIPDRTATAQQARERGCRSESPAIVIGSTDKAGAPIPAPPRGSGVAARGADGPGRRRDYRNGPVRMSATVVRGDGDVRAGAQANGTFKQLLRSREQLVFGLTTELGIQLTDAERQRIMRQGPKNLAAFLAYSQGWTRWMGAIIAPAAAGSPPRCVLIRPSRRLESISKRPKRHRRCRRHPAMSVTVVEAVSQITAPPEPASVGALQHVTTDVSQTITDVTGQSGLTSTLSHPTQESQGVTNVVQTFGVIPDHLLKLP